MKIFFILKMTIESKMPLVIRKYYRCKYVFNLKNVKVEFVKKRVAIFDLVNETTSFILPRMKALKHSFNMYL